MDYKKLNAPLKERIVFLFTGLLSVKYIIPDITDISATQYKQEEKTNINNKERDRADNSNLKLNIPFFDLDNSETKSNL